MAAHPGNQYAKKLVTPELRREAYEQYCQHVSEGYSRKSFTFHKGDFKVTWETIDKYMQESPEEFPPIHMQFAKAQGYKHWEKVVSESAIGKNLKANTASLQMIMRNKFDWDKETKSQNTNEAEVRSLMNKLENKA